MNRVRQNPWAIAAVVLLPVLVLGILLAALWNPVDRLDTVQAAIVNNDEPVEVDGQTAPLGRQLAAGLVGGSEDSDVNYDWTLTDAEHAADGLADGTFAAVVTIPEDFSAAATSFGSEDAGDARQATIDISTPPGGRVVDDALARIVGTTATSVMGSTLTETYVDNVLIGFGDLAEGIGEAADGAHQLADGAGEAADGADDLADGAGQLADGADEYADGVGQAADGADQLADGVNQYAAGVGAAADGGVDLADGANQFAAGVGAAADGTGPLVDGAAQVAGGVAGIAEGAGPLADGTQQVADRVTAISGGIRESADGADDLADGGYDLADGADEVAAGVRGLADQADQIDAELPSEGEIQAGLDDISAGYEANADQVAEALAQASTALGCDADPTSDACVQLAAVEESLTSLSDDVTGDFDEFSDGLLAARGQVTALADGTGKLATGAEGVATGTRGIADGNADLASGLRTLASGNDQVADGAGDLADGAGDLADGASQLAPGAAGVAGGVAQLADGIGALDSGAQELATGVSGFADGIGQLDTGAQGLATGANGLASGFGPLQTGASELATGMSGVADGTDGLADGVGDLASGTDDLAGGLDEAADGIPTYSEDDRQNLSSVVADPVTAPGVNDLSTGATGPLFAVMALWLGALALLTIFPPVVAHALGSTRSALRLTFAAAAAPAAIGAGTGALVGIILAAVEGLSLLGWVGAILVGALVSVTFVAVHLGFLAWLGNVGRAISLLIAVMLIGTGVVATVPAVLTSIVDFLPTGAGRDALSAVVVDGVGGLGAALGLLVLWLAVGLLLGVGAAARARRTRVSVLLRG
ncbi:YhgE/Pip family protein [Isoptericola jiangsuensis]|uniref:YhgE/Pip domain-containing protein n=1 Tax=Isoptericola jiangsuensis TaxID=548579 RepID=UPI003AAABFA4